MLWQMQLGHVVGRGAVVGGAGVTAPVNTAVPVISGTAQVGQTLTTTNGTWTGSPTSYTYQWKRGGANISGATSSTYVLVSADVGTTITSTVTATNSSGSTSATSSGVAILFTPLNLTGLIGWWDASVFASMTIVAGNQISAIADQSGGGHTMSQAGFANPTYNATGFNSKPAMMVGLTGGSTAGFQTATGFPMGTGNTLTAWYVGTLGNIASGSNVRAINYIAPSGNDFGSANSWGVYRSAATTSSLIRNFISATSSALSADPAPYRMIYTINSSGLITIYANGVAVGTATSSGNWASGGKSLIGSQDTGSNFWSGPFGELGIATGYSDATTVAQLDTYLKNKWGL